MCGIVTSIDDLGTGKIGSCVGLHISCISTCDSHLSDDDSVRSECVGSHVQDSVDDKVRSGCGGIDDSLDDHVGSCCDGECRTEDQLTVDLDDSIDVRGGCVSDSEGSVVDDLSIDDHGCGHDSR